MIRGTTPTHTFKTDISLLDCTVVYLTYKQNGSKIVEKTKEDLTITEDQVVVTLSQKETLGFEEGVTVEIQFRVGFADGSRAASNIMSAPVKRILKDGII